MSLIYRIENTNKKYKEEDIDGKYVDTELEIEVKNEKYVAGREGSKKYLTLNLKNLIKKDLTEFTYLFKDIVFEIIEIKKDNTGRIIKIVIQEKDKDKETTNKQGTGDIFKKIEKKDKNKKDKEDENVNRAGIDEAIKKKKADENSPKTNIKGTSEGNRYKNNQ